jgi:hypothetical protein
MAVCDVCSGAVFCPLWRSIGFDEPAPVFTTSLDAPVNPAPRFKGGTQ